MFLEKPDLTSLRQGDILTGIPFPLLSFALPLQASPDGDHLGPVPSVKPITHVHHDDPQWVTAHVPVRFGYCAVLTHCCRLEARAGNRLSVPVITLVRLRPIPKSFMQNPQHLEALRGNRNPLDPQDPGVLDYFYVEPHQALEGKEWVVDFHQVVALPSKHLEQILGRKILQMDDQSRMKFKFKYSACVSRPTDEELAKPELREPWKPEQTPLQFADPTADKATTK